VSETSPNVVWHHAELTREERWKPFNLNGATVWLTGLSGSGKSTIAAALERRLVEAGRPAYLLDGDNLRHGLNGDLGFDRAARDENVRRVAHVARLIADAGLVAIAPLISPYAEGRARARQVHSEAGLSFLEVYVRTPIEECERRDPKGLYAKARAGELTGFTGIDDPYEEPESADIVIPGDTMGVDEAAELIANGLP
jgi:bifunctional enzyme CysN/CysC